MAVKLTPWDSAEYLTSDKAIAAYMEAVFEDGDPALIARALGNVARAKGMAQVAQETGLGRESLYKALSGEKDPRLSTIMKIVHALGLRLTVTA